MRRNANLPVIGLALGLFLAAGCAGPAKTTAPVKETANSQILQLSGKVTETANGGGYTYLCIEKDGKKTWGAIPTRKISIGQEVVLQTGSVMENFESKTMNRTFDRIIFSGGLQEDLAVKTAPQDEKYAAKMSKTPILSGKIVETMNAPGYTYLLLEKDGKVAWSAIPTTKVKVGDEVELIPGIDMGKFASATLKRSFDGIHFSAGIKGAQGQQPEAAQQDAKLPEGHPTVDAKALAQANNNAASATAAKPVTGKVVETMKASGYSYICLEKDGEKTWVAIPATDVAVGQEMSVAPGNQMTNFSSKTLNRKFDKIIFSNGPMKN